MSGGLHDADRTIGFAAAVDARRGGDAPGCVERASVVSDRRRRKRVNRDRVAVIEYPDIRDLDRQFWEAEMEVQVRLARGLVAE